MHGQINDALGKHRILEDDSKNYWCDCEKGDRVVHQALHFCLGIQFDNDRPKHCKEDLNLAKLREIVAAMISIRPPACVHSKSEERNKQAPYRLPCTARGLEKDGDANEREFS